MKAHRFTVAAVVFVVVFFWHVLLLTPGAECSGASSWDVLGSCAAVGGIAAWAAFWLATNSKE